jgi:hypothetical protein
MDNSESNIDRTQILAALQHLQQENVVLRDSVTRLQNQPPPLAPVPPALAMVTPEPQISLPEKFDDTTRVGFVGTLLTGTATSWFAPILETSSPLLQDFNAFMAKFEAVFGDNDKAKTSANKLRRLQQGTRSAIVYASEFRQLTCDVN